MKFRKEETEKGKGREERRYKRVKGREGEVQERETRRGKMQEGKKGRKGERERCRTGEVRNVRQNGIEGKGRKRQAETSRRLAIK